MTVQQVLDVLRAEAAQNPACKILQDLVLFDEYRGKGLEADEKSLAFRLSLQDTQATLQDDRVDAAMQALIAAASRETGARLR